jgi:hypothetical protein
MNVRRALTYLFADPRWPSRLGIAMLLNLLPTAMIAYRQLVMEDGDPQSAELLGNLAWTGVTTFAMIPIYGYLLRIVRNVVAGADLPLPEWTDVQRLLRDGLALWGIVFVWGLPGNLLGSAAGTASGEDDTGRILLSLLGMLLVLVVVYAVLIVQPAAEARLAVTGSFLAGLDVRAALATVRRNLGGYIRLLLVTLVGGVGIFGIGFGLVWLVQAATGGAPTFSRVLTIATILVGLTLGPYLQFALYHLYGQVYARAMP